MLEVRAVPVPASVGPRFAVDAVVCVERVAIVVSVLAAAAAAGVDRLCAAAREVPPSLALQAAYGFLSILVGVVLVLVEVEPFPYDVVCYGGRGG